MVTEGLRRTGYDEVSLTSLSSADYSGIEDVVGGIINDPSCQGTVGVSLPSLRVDAYTVGIASEIAKVRRTGLTFAPEAGTWRMRQVINKLIREEDLYGAVESAELPLHEPHVPGVLETSPTTCRTGAGESPRRLSPPAVPQSD